MKPSELTTLGAVVKRVVWGPWCVPLNEQTALFYPGSMEPKGSYEAAG